MAAHARRRPLLLRVPGLATLLLTTLLAVGAQPGFAGRAAAAPAQQTADVAPFSSEWTSTESGYLHGLAWGDADGDGDLDLAVGDDCRPFFGTRGCAGLRLYRNEGSRLSSLAGWSAESSPDDELVGRSLAWGDMDGDGDLDLAIGGYVDTSNQAALPLRVYRNLSSPSALKLKLEQAWVAPEARFVNSVAWADMDGDGKLDLVVGVGRYFPTKTPQKSLIYRNSSDAGTATFTQAWEAAADAITMELAPADVDGDGDLDLLAANDTGTSAIYRNDSAGGATALSDGPTLSVTASDAAWGDFTGDGKPDLVFAGPGGVTGYTNSSAGAAISFDAASWSALGTSRNSLDVGDADNDGDLDIVASQACSQNNLSCISTVLLRNDSTVTAGSLSALFTTAWSSTLRDQTNHVALADMDGDGNLDMAATNDFDQPARVFRNFYGGLSTSSVFSSTETANTNALAWGDLDADGLQDLAVARSDNSIVALRNTSTGGAMALEPVWSSAPATAVVYDLAWGDGDGDGDLDLASASPAGVRVFRNTGTLLAAGAPTTIDDSADAEALAWGDMDGDGDLDLATDVGLFSNQSTTDAFSFTQAAWAPQPGDNTRDVAWGDVDSDGDLDLAIANYFQANRLYLNTAGVVSPTPAWSASTEDASSGVRFGDVDGDGDLDLAIANDGQANRVYRNDNGVIVSEPLWASLDNERTTDLSFGDVDGDGDLDLAVVNLEAPTRIYRNDRGRLTERSVWESSATASGTSLGWADVDGDGDLDLARSGSNLGTPFGPLQILRNGSAGTQLRVNNPPAIALVVENGATPAGTLALAEQSGPARVLTGQTLSFDYTLRDREGDPVRELRAEFSLDGGGSWAPAIAAGGTITSNLTTSPGGVQHSFSWDTFASGFFGQSDDVRLRLIASPALGPAVKGTPGSFQRPASATSSAPFRVRGTQVRALRPDASAAAGAVIYRLTGDQVVGGVPFLRSDGTPYSTDVRGYLPGRGQLNVGDRLVALQPIFKSTSDERSGYTLYHTSAPTTTTGLSAFTVSQPGVQTLTVGPEHPLILFHLKLSLEWDARADSVYLSQLRSDLLRTSELLYRWSDGQLALGNVTIYHDRAQWAEADVRVFATNRLRPNANLGGIVTAPISETLSVGGASRTFTYEPGQIRMGTVWSRYGGSGGGLGGEDWARALGHEIGHYALFLDENYLGLDGSGRLVSVESCPSPMADVYRDDHGKFHPDAGWLPRCADTLSNRNTGRSDWRTIKAFYDRANLSFALNMPPRYDAESGPNLLPLALTTIKEPAGAAPPALPATLYSLEAAEGGIYRTGVGARAFHFVCATGPCGVGSSSPDDRIVDLGQPATDELLALGTRPGERLCVYDLDAGSLGCEPVRAGDSRLVVGELGARAWEPNVLVTPVTSTTLSLSVTNLPPGLSLGARLYPVGGPASAPITLSAQGAAYTGQLAAADAVLTAYVHLWVEESATPRRELVVDFGLGGNPTKSKSTGKDKDSGKSKKAPALSPDGQVVLFGDALNFASGTYYSIQGLSNMPVAEPRWTVAVGKGYRLIASVGAPDLQQATISMGYYEGDMAPGTEAGVAIYYLADGAQTWRRLPTVLDTRENEATASAQGPGSYALMTALGLSSGWNMLSYPWPRPAVPLAEALELLNADGGFTTIYGYNPAASADPWQIYDVDAPGWVNDLGQMVYGRGYWVRVPDGVTANAGADGGAAEQAGALPQPPSTFYGALESGVPGQVVRALIGDQVCATTTAREVDGAVVFVIDVPAASEQAGCGLPGTLVKVETDGALFAVVTWTGERPGVVTPGTELPRPFKLFIPIARD